MSFLPRFLSGLIEIDDAWLRSPVISGSLRPFGDVALGDVGNPFGSLHVGDVTNRYGEMKVNDVSSGSVIDLVINEGVLAPTLKFNDSLTIDPNGNLGVRNRVLTPSNIEFAFSDPLHFELDEEDQVGGNVSLKYDADDLELKEGRLKIIRETWKGFGALKVGGISDFDALDSIFDDLSDEDMTIPLLKAIRLQTSDDFTQSVNSRLSIRPKGIIGSIPYYSLSGLAGDESLYYNSVANTLSVPRVLMQTRFVLSPNEATTQAYVAQFIQALPGGGIDVLPEVQGTGRREIRVRVDPSGCIMNDPSMAGALDVRCDSVTLVKKAGVLSANYMGDEDGDVVVQGNMIRSIMTFNAPLVKTGNVVSLNLLAEAPDLTYAAGTLICNIDAAPGGGLIKAGPLLSLAPERLQQLDDATQDITDTKESLENVNDKLTETTQKVNDAVEDITDVKSGLEGVNDTANAARTAADAAANTASQAARTAGDVASRIGDLSSVMDGLDLGKTIGISVGTSMLTSAVTTSISAAALGLAAQSQAQNIISNSVGKAIGVGAAFAGLFGAIGGAIGGALGKKGNQNTYISYNSYSGGGIAEKEGDEEDRYLYGWSLCNPTEYDATLYPDRALAVAGFTPLLGSGLLPVESTNARTGQLICVGGFGASGNVHAGKDVYANGRRLATEDFLSAQLVPYATQSWVTGQGYITASALTPYLLASTASSTYQPLITAGAGLSKSGNTISLVGDAVLSSLDVGSGMLSVKKTPWNEPTMTANSQNGYLVSCSSSFASNYDAWYAFNKQGGSWYSTDGRYQSTAPFAYIGSNVTIANGVSYGGEWLQFKGIVPVYLTSYTLDAAAAAQTSTSFVLLGSKDGTTWSLLDTQTDLAWAGITRRTFNISVSTSYTYFRIVCRQALASYVGFGEFKMNGYVEELKSRSDTFTWNGMNVATEGFVTSQGYITSAALAPYSTTSAMNSAISTAVAPLATTAYVDSSVAPMALKSYVDTQIATRQISGNYTTTTALNTALSSYYDKTTTDTKLATKQNSFTLLSSLFWNNNQLGVATSQITSLGTLDYLTVTNSIGARDLTSRGDGSTGGRLNLGFKENTTQRDFAMKEWCISVDASNSLIFSDTFNSPTLNPTLKIAHSGSTGRVDITTSLFINSVQAATINDVNTAVSTYQPILTAGTGLTKTGNTLSVNAAQTGITSVGTLTGLTSSGNVNIGESVTAANATRSLNLVSATGAVIRVWRKSDVATQNPSVELLWGTGETPTLYWDFFVNSTGSFVIRDRIGGNNDRLLLNSSGNVVIPSTTAASSTTTGALQVAGGVGIGGSLYAANMFIGTNPVATQAYVTGLGYITSSDLTPYLTTATAASTYLTTATAASTYQAILTAGTGLTKSGNTVSLNQDLSVSSISAAGFSTNNVAWTEPNMTSLTNGVYTVSASSINASTYAAWRPLDSFESYEWLSAANYFNTTPSPTLSASTTVSGTAIRGEWWQLQVPVPTMITSYSIKAHAASLPTRAPTQWLFCGSVDGSTWDQIDSQAGQSSWTSTNLTLTFNISQSKPYSYFRFIFQKTSGTYDTMVAIKRIRFIGFQANLKWYTSRIPTVEELSQKANTFSVTSPLTLSSSNTIGIDLSSYLTSATAASTYQPTVTAGTGLTKAGNTISLDSSALSPYLTTATAASTYQPIITAGTGLTKAGNTISLDSSALSPYLTTATAASTYQPIITGGTNLTVNEILTSGKATIGGTLWANTINSNFGRTTIPSQVYISNGGANNYNWTTLSASTGGALEVEGSSVFHSPVLISGKNKIANPTGGSFRWFSYDNTGTSSTQGTNPYGFILGQNTYMLGSVGSMCHMYSDSRCKTDIVTLDPEKALDIVKKQRAVSFKYRDAADKRFGMIAQECIEKELLRDLVSVAKMGDEDERFVMNTQDTTFILWAAVAQLAREVQELKKAARG